MALLLRFAVRYDVTSGFTVAVRVLAQLEHAGRNELKKSRDPGRGWRAGRYNNDGCNIVRKKVG